MVDSSDPNGRKEPMKYSKVVANIPEGLLKEFDEICDGRYYSRAEGLKQAMREFIINSLPEDYVPASINKKQNKEGIEGLLEGLLHIASDPRVQQLQNQSPSQSINIQPQKLIKAKSLPKEK
jgi:metal-responsive CopG/Arc/MetJ family transcriptional regulator